MPASTQILDFWFPGTVGDMEVPRDHKGRMLVLTKKQQRRRALRKIGAEGRKKGSPLHGPRNLRQANVREAIAVMYKPLDEWDEDELARGMPKGKDGTFKGKVPEWLPREVHEYAIDRFKDLVRGKMRVNANKAIDILEAILDNEAIDEKGKPVVPASTKLDAAKFLIEHVVGKPKQEIQADISVRLQAVLAAATQVGPGLPEGVVDMPSTLDDAMAEAQSIVDAESWEEEDDDPDT